MIGLFIVVDDRALHALHDEAVASLKREQPQMMKRILDAAAANEVASHRYQNRTGDLEASTFASDIYDVGEQVTVELGARAPYASYVEARGFSNMSEIAERVDPLLGAALAAEAERLGQR
jgi:hypothetical protein